MQRARGTDRLLDILEYCETLNAPASRHAIAEALNCPRSTVYVLADQLVERGWLEQNDSKDVSLGHRAGRLGLAYGKQARFEQHMRDAIQRLARDIGEVVEVNIVDRWQQLILMSATGKEHNYLRASEGSLFPLPQTASGLILLEGVTQATIEKNVPPEHFRFNNGTVLSIENFMEEISQTSLAGYAIGRGMIDHYIGTICTALRDRIGRVIGVLCVVVPLSELDGRMELILPKLQTTAAELSRMLTIMSWSMGEQALQEIDVGR